MHLQGILAHLAQANPRVQTRAHSYPRPPRTIPAPFERMFLAFLENFVASEIANQFGHKLLKEAFGYFCCCFVVSV
jgi:hypothetical protein